MICPYCGQPHPANARFCPVTGDSLSKKLPSFIFLVIGFVGFILISAGVWILLDGSGIRVLKLPSEPPSAAKVESTATPKESSWSEFQSVDTPAPDYFAAHAAQTVAVRHTQAGLPTTITPSSTQAPTQTKTSTTGPWEACPGASPSRLNIGDRAYVSYEPPLPNRVRQYPGTQSKVLGRIQPGEEVIIFEGPGCADNWVWWRIRSEVSGLTGWTAEGDHKDYWLVPMP